MKIDKIAIMTTLPLKFATTITPVTIVEADEDDGTIPSELRDWLVRLRLLEGVPFAYLVADTELLPEESIRFFYVDRRWTDAVVQGALSVGTVNTDDRIQLTAQYPAVRDELDQEERNLRRAPGTQRLAGETGPISGFILRSRAVSGWPALHVRAFSVEPDAADTAPIDDDDPARMRLLRLERLAPAVLLCLFDGIPRVVHIEEPRQGVQFGFDGFEQGGQLRAELKPRNVNTADDLNVAPIPVPFRAGGNGVVDIQALERALAPLPNAGAADRLNSAEYALHLIQFPYRQVFGEPREAPVREVFRPTIAYAALADRVFRMGGQ